MAQREFAPHSIRLYASLFGRFAHWLIDRRLNVLTVQPTDLFEALPPDMRSQIAAMPTEALKMACAAYLADELPEIVAMLS